MTRRFRERLASLTRRWANRLDAIDAADPLIASRLVGVAVRLRELATAIDVRPAWRCDRCGGDALACDWCADAYDALAERDEAIARADRLASELDHARATIRLRTDQLAAIEGERVLWALERLERGL